MGAAENAAEGRALTTTGFSMCGFSITGFSGGGQVNAPEHSATKFPEHGFPNRHRE